MTAEIFKAENATLKEKWLWKMNYCKTNELPPAQAWDKAETAWRETFHFTERNPE